MVEPIAITLPVIYTAVLDFRAEVIETLERQRADLAEGQSLLFKQTELHRKRLDEHAAELEWLKRETGERERRLRTDVEELRRRMAHVELLMGELRG